MARFLSRTLGVSLACWLLIACGGEAVVDAVAAGGHGGSTTTGTGTGTTSTGTGTGSTTTGTGAGTGPTCEQLQQELGAWIHAATACDPDINGLQCTGMTVVYDDCGCVVVASDYNADAAQAAVAAYDVWVAAGCGPWDCYACPPGPDTPWYCDLGTAQCTPAYE